MLTVESLASFCTPPRSELPALSGRVLVVGSGPNAALPPDFDGSWKLATVNASQVVAEGLGVGLPDVTLFGAGVLKSGPVNLEAQQALAGRRTKALIMTKGSRRFSYGPVKLAMMGYSYETFHYLYRDICLGVVAEPLGEEVPWPQRPSTGIMLAFLCIRLGCDQVVMTGFSLTRDGHAYNDSGRARRHSSDDAAWLGKAAAAGVPIATNDPVFAGESGLPLYGYAQPNCLAGRNALRSVLR